MYSQLRNAIFALTLFLTIAISTAIPTEKTLLKRAWPSFDMSRCVPNGNCHIGFQSERGLVHDARFVALTLFDRDCVQIAFQDLIKWGSQKVPMDAGALPWVTLVTINDNGKGDVSNADRTVPISWWYSNHSGPEAGEGCDCYTSSGLEEVQANYCFCSYDCS